MPDKEVLEDIFSISKNNKYVLKMNRGNQGIGVNLISGTQSLKSILETFHALNDQKFIIQPYIEHKKELRIFVIKNQIMAIIEKTITSEDFRGNSKRSKARFIKTISNEIHEEIITLIGADETIIPEQEIGIRLADRLASPFRQFFPITHYFAMTQIQAPDDFVGSTLQKLDLYKRFNVTCVARKEEEEFLSISQEYVVQDGDIIHFMFNVTASGKKK
jgi:hypothetical protein